MPQFDRCKRNELRNYLYQSNIHDAELKECGYDRGKKTLTVKTINPIHGGKINFTFGEIRAILFAIGDSFGSDKTIISLTVEEDYSHLQNCTQVCGKELEDSVYLLFQMLSGDELHIVCDEIFVDTVE